MKEFMWKTAYHATRMGVVVPLRTILRASATLEGVLPPMRPLYLAPVHRTPADTGAIGSVIPEYISYVSTDSFGNKRWINAVQECWTLAMGGVILTQIDETRPLRERREETVRIGRNLRSDMFERLDRRLIIAGFSQGEYQRNDVSSINHGLFNILQRWEEINKVRVPIVPVGLDYGGDVKMLPHMPRWQVPDFGTRITVRLGEPVHFEDKSSVQLADIVMREAAQLSRIPYNA